MKEEQKYFKTFSSKEKSLKFCKIITILKSFWYMTHNMSAKVNKKTSQNNNITKKVVKNKLSQ
jgi:hypothetical protein